MGIARGRVRGIKRDRAAVEDACEHGDAVRHLRPRTNAQARQRIGGAACGQIYRGKPRPTGYGDNEFLVKALLADLDVELVAKFLLIPELPKPNALGRVDVAEGLQDQEVVLIELAAINLEAADVEGAALETKRFLGVHLQRNGGQSFRFETLLGAAGEIAEHFDVLEYGERHAVLG